MSKISNMYKNNQSKFITNNKEYCYLENIKDIRKKFDEIFVDKSKMYKYKVLIQTKNNQYKTYLIGKTDEYFVTVNDEKININDILSIEIVN